MYKYLQYTNCISFRLNRTKIGLKYGYVGDACITTLSLNRTKIGLKWATAPPTGATGAKFESD